MTHLTHTGGADTGQDDAHQTGVATAEGTIRDRRERPWSESVTAVGLRRPSVRRPAYDDFFSEAIASTPLMAGIVVATGLSFDSFSLAAAAFSSAAFSAAFAFAIFSARAARAMLSGVGSGGFSATGAASTGVATGASVGTGVGVGAGAGAGAGAGLGLGS